MNEEHFRRVGKRKVFNGKRLLFQAQDKDVEPPLALSSTLLSLALSLSREGSSSLHFAALVDSTNFLKSISLAGMPDVERMAFFLNIFHTLLLHALLVLGPPAADLAHWNSFFSRISYEISGHILSLAEIEHNILRAKGVKPKLLWALIPKWNQTDPRRQLSLSSFDPRVDVLLNYGSKMGPQFIPRFCPGEVEVQLDEAVSRMLEWTVRVDVAARTVTLSKMLYWYRGDFGTSEMDVVRWILRNSSPALAQRFLEIDPTGSFRPKSVYVKYYNFEYNFHEVFEKLSLDNRLPICYAIPNSPLDDPASIPPNSTPSLGPPPKPPARKPRAVRRNYPASMIVTHSPLHSSTFGDDGEVKEEREKEGFGEGGEEDEVSGVDQGGKVQGRGPLAREGEGEREESR